LSDMRRRSGEGAGIAGAAGSSPDGNRRFESAPALSRLPGFREVAEIPPGMGGVGQPAFVHHMAGTTLTVEGGRLSYALSLRQRRLAIHRRRAARGRQ